MQLGKIPGKRRPDGTWTGFYAWQSNRATPLMLERWQGWQDTTGPFASAIRTGVFLAGDVDINDEAIAEEITVRVIASLGTPGATRRRFGNPRRVLFYGHMSNTDPIAKRKIKFRIIDTGEECAIELLGEGQQVVIEGPHAKGAMHYWQDDIGLIEGIDAMRDNLLTLKDVNNLIADLQRFIEADPRFELIKASLPGSSTGDRADAVSIDDLMSPHVAEDREMLARAIAKIDINAPALSDYDSWINLLRAIKAACVGDHAFFIDTVWPWLQGNAGNVSKGIEWVEERWNSFRDSQLGARFVYQTAFPFDSRSGQMATPPTYLQISLSPYLCLVESQAHKAWRETHPEEWEADLAALAAQLEGQYRADLLRSLTPTPRSPTSAPPAYQQSGSTAATEDGKS